MIPSLPLAATVALVTAVATTPFSAAATRQVALRAVAPVAATPIPTSILGRPVYDVAEHALRIPFTGTVPVWTQGTLLAPPRLFLDFQAPTRLRGVVSGGVSGHPVWLSWAMAPRNGSQTRLTLVFRRETIVAVRVDRQRGLLWIVPRTMTENNPAPEASTGIDFGVATPMPRRTPAMALPTAQPIPTPRPSATPFVSPFESTRPTATPWVPATPGPTMTPWIMPVASPRPTMTPWIPATPRPGQTPWVTPVATAAPGVSSLVASPAATPTITISTAPPAALPPAKAGLAEVYAATAIAYGPYEETGGTPGALSARADNQRANGVRLAVRVGSQPDAPATDGWQPGWALGLDLYGVDANYVTNTLSATQTLTGRQAWRGHLNLSRGIRLSPLELTGGLGLLARHETLWRSVVPTVSARSILAPEIVLSANLPLGGPMSLYGDGAIAPAAFAWANGAPALGLGGLLTAGRIEAGLAAELKGLRLGLGYRRWSLNSGTYNEVFQGPVLTVGGWLNE